MQRFIHRVTSHNNNTIMMDTLDVSYINREIYITGEIDIEMATIVNSALRCLARESNEDITLYIQSPGGSVSAGFSILDTAKATKCDIVTVACGMAASMGAFILCAAGTKGKRYAQPRAEVLIHQPLAGITGQASDIRIHTEHLLKTRELINKILAEACGQSIETIENDTERDKIFDAEAAKKYGLIDHVGEPLEAR